MTDALYADEMDLFSLTTPKFKIDKPIRLIELFSGIGAQAKALENLGADFVHWRAVEFDKFAMASYNAIHGTNFAVSDIRDVHAADLDIRDTDKFCYIMTYSFPCQDLSPIGQKKGMAKGSGTRSGLLWEVERILDECTELPQVLLMENVPMVIGKKNIRDFQSWRRKLETLGYANYVQLLDAKDYGIPQNRDRCFMVSVLGNNEYRFPVKQPLKTRMLDILEDKVDGKRFLSSDTVSYFIKHSEDQKKIGNGFRFEPIHRNKCEIAKPITTKEGTRTTDNYIIENDGTVRKLTPKECWRLMGFTDDDFSKAMKVNSDCQLVKQAGNSIVVQLLGSIFKEMMGD